MTRLGNNLVIRVNGDTEDEITIKDYFSATYYQIESVVFDSGTIWTTADIATKSAQIFGTENDDEIKSFTGGANYSLNQTIYAYEGDDTITGSNGSEMFFAGKGDDTVIGGRGNDTYYFNLGDGKDILTDYDNGYSDSRSDKIVFGEGISSDTTYMTRHGNDLIIKINGDTEDEITVKSYFSDSYYQIESIIFNDGTIWTTGDISTNSAQIFGSDEDDTISTFTGGTNYSLNQTVYAYEGDDTITGSNGSEKFITGKGDDTVSGGRGNDTYFFNLGDGKDTITDYDNGYSDSRSDKIIFGDGISADKTYMTRQSNDLIIKVNGDTTDEITISNYFSASYYQIENITFADGSVWTTADISTKSAQIFGSNEDDVISAFTGGSNYSLNQTIFAYEGNDTITGSNGSEIFFAGKGNDIISGGRGNDTYYFNLGDGKDTLTDYDNGYSDSRSDKIVFGEGISAEKTYMTRLGNNLIIKINGDTEDEIVIKDYFSASYYQIEKISFADGTVWTTADISTKSAQIFGSNEDDVISAFTGGSNYSLNQKVYAYEGNDTITGSNGSETFVAGSGDDTVSGGRGNDTYVFNLGDGKDILTDYDNGYSDSRSDKIVFGEGISADKTYMTRKSNDLVIRINGDTEDEITVKNYFSATYYQIESITFNNGTIWTTADISTKSAQIFGSNEDDTISTFTGGANYSLNQTIYTYEGNDTISGSNGNETFIGGKGNDSISGSGGNDTYIFNLGDGKDTITDNNSGYTDSDKIIFGEGIETSDLIFSRQGYNLLINISGTDDTITIKNHYYTQYYRIENFQTADGSTLTYTNIEYLIQAMAEFTADTGMTVSEAAQENNQAYSDIVNQMWVSQTVA
jgi:Ca2+-binding RTX toxin-like protein